MILVRSLLFLLVPILAGALSQTQDPRSGGASGGELLPEQAAFDVVHVRLELQIDPGQQKIAGTAVQRLRFEEDAEWVALHLDGRLEVHEVALGDKPLRFKHKDGLIRARLRPPVAAGDEALIRVTYSGKPRVAPRPPWDGGFTWSKTPAGEPWISTTCQGEGADLWWPCKDHPSDKPESMDIIVTVPDGLFCASNGVLQSDVRNGDGTCTQHWSVRSPISNYNVALNIAPYEELEVTYTSVDGTKFPFVFYHLPSSSDGARAIFPEFVDHLRFFEELLGPYPFRAEKYGVVETPHLGMEHQTIIAYGNKFRRSGYDYDWLHHHELSHEWWGNLVTCRDWKDMWIHEGIGTYMQPLFLEQRFGEEVFHKRVAELRNGLRNRRPVAPREIRDSKEIYFDDKGADNDIYSKGALILHTLRWTIGDEAFFESLRKMCYPTDELLAATDGSQVRLVDTEDYRRIVEEACGLDLANFFEVYLRRAELPELEIKAGSGKLRLRWKVLTKEPFEVPLPVQVGDELLRVPMDGGKATIEIGRALFEVDPAGWVLRAQ